MSRCISVSCGIPCRGCANCACSRWILLYEKTNIDHGEESDYQDCSDNQHNQRGFAEQARSSCNRPLDKVSVFFTHNAAPRVGVPILKRINVTIGSRYPFVAGDLRARYSDFQSYGISVVGWAKRSVPTNTILALAAGTLRFAHPINDSS